MARNHIIISNVRETQIDMKEINKWFYNNDFDRIHFKNGRFEISTITIYHNIREHKGYKTFIRPSYGGSVLIFEVRLKFNKIEIQCYAPIQLFGFIKVELSFKEKASWITKYRSEGYKIMLALEQFIRNKLTTIH